MEIAEIAAAHAKVVEELEAEEQTTLEGATITERRA